MKNLMKLMKRFRVFSLKNNLIQQQRKKIKKPQALINLNNYKNKAKDLHLLQRDRLIQFNQTEARETIQINIIMGMNK